MRLQLDSSIGAAADLHQVSDTGAASSSRSSASGVQPGSDRTSISGAASLLAASASNRATRIEQLSAAVQAGTYQPSSSAISHAIVSQALP